MSSTPRNGNPLLEIRHDIPFDQVRAEDVGPAMDELLAQAQRDLDRLANDTGPRTYANTMLALEQVTERLDYAMGVVHHLESVATTPEFRAAYNEAEPRYSAFRSAIPLNQGLWENLKRFASTPEAQKLSPTRRRALERRLESFRRYGADLDQAGKDRLAAIDVELSHSTTTFSQHVLDATNRWELIVEDENRLKGLPPIAVAGARESAQAKGRDGWRFTLQAPSYIALITYLDDEGIREQAYRAFITRASSGELDNREVAAAILRLRREKAQLLGYEDFAQFILEDRMAKTGTKALRFLRDLEARTRPSFERENRELEQFAGRSLKPWDVPYWAEKQRRALYDFDEEQLRPYFETQRVVAGMFEIVERLYAIRVVEKPGVPVWHPDVRHYEIHDSSGLVLGSFYADWYPRENKRDGAWMDGFINGVDEPGHHEAHVGCICGNLTPPGAGRPALLTHREVETIFHEFGHLLHQCLSRVEVRWLAGTNVAWDFVELPSQIMENWCWEREALDLFARHYQTGEPVPEDLFRKMVRARNFRSANAAMRQLGFGIVDLLLHTAWQPARDGDVLTFARRILQQFAPAPLDDDYAMIAGFTHLFGDPVGYGAGYYSYKWAEVLDADAFTRFQQNGIFSREVGLEFRNKILARGNSDDPAVLYRDFMGRDPDLNALLEREGLGLDAMPEGQLTV